MEFKEDFALDIETPKEYTLVTFLRFRDGKFFEFQIYHDEKKPKDDREMLRGFLGQMTPGVRVFTFNGIRFDLPVLWEIIQCEILTPKQLTLHISEYASRIIEEDDFWPEKGVWRFTHADVKELLNIKRNLKRTAASMGFTILLDFEFTTDLVCDFATRKKIKNYCRVDTLATRFIAEHPITVGELEDRETLAELYDLDLYTKGRPRVAKVVMAQLYQEEFGVNVYAAKKRRWGDSAKSIYSKLSKMTIEFSDLVIDKYKFTQDDFRSMFVKVLSFSRKGYVAKEEKFSIGFEHNGVKYSMGEGGLHDELGAVLEFSDQDYVILNIDASSFYPKIISVNELDPEHLPGWSQVLGNITDFRLEAKAKSKVDEKSKRIAGSTKIVINSAFGQLLDVFSPFFDLKAGIGTTINGQLLLLQIVDWLTKSGIDYRVLEANTDGVCVKVFRGDIPKLKEVCSFWVKRFGIELEIDELGAFWKLNANSYLEIDPQGQVIKGVKDFYIGVDPNKALKFPIINEALVAYCTNDIPIEDTIRAEKDIRKFTTVVSGASSFSENPTQCYFEIDGAGPGKVQRNGRYYRAIRGGKYSRTFIKRNSNVQFPGADSVRLLLEINDMDASAYPDLDYAWYVSQAIDVLKPLCDANSPVRQPDLCSEESQEA